VTHLRAIFVGRDGPLSVAFNERGGGEQGNGDDDDDDEGDDEDDDEDEGESRAVQKRKRGGKNSSSHAAAAESSAAAARPPKRSRRQQPEAESSSAAAAAAGGGDAWMGVAAAARSGGRSGEGRATEAAGDGSRRECLVRWALSWVHHLCLSPPPAASTAAASDGLEASLDELESLGALPTQVPPSGWPFDEPTPLCARTQVTHSFTHRLAHIAESWRPRSMVTSPQWREAAAAASGLELFDQAVRQRVVVGASIRSRTAAPEGRLARRCAHFFEPLRTPVALLSAAAHVAGFGCQRSLTSMWRQGPRWETSRRKRGRCR